SRGDRITVGEYTGVVRNIGLSHIEMRRADGGMLTVPNRLLNQHVLTVERVQNTTPVRVELELEARPDPDLMSVVRGAATLSPYRLGGSAVQVEVLDDGRGLAVEIQAWSARAIQDAELHLSRSLRRVLAEAGGESSGQQ
ncbi:MAG: mechanosensitive ion channel domain-containing protein, partial [Myxococcota bacterium]